MIVSEILTVWKWRELMERGEEGVEMGEDLLYWI